MNPSDRVRQYCRETYVEPARLRREPTCTIRVGDVHDALGFRSRHSLVSGAIGTRKFELMCAIVKRTVSGPVNGPNAVYMFELQ